jgi:predicted permease
MPTSSRAGTLFRTPNVNLDSLVLLVGCLILGWFVAHFAKPPQGLSQHLNWWVLNVALAAGLGNTALVGFPLIEALRHQEGLALAAFTDTLGCLFSLAVGGITVAAMYSGGKPDPRVIVRRVVLFPAFIALIVGLIVSAAGGWPAPLETLVARVGATLTPVALFSIGLQFSLRVDRSRLGAAALALGWKLALAPLVIYAIGTAAGVSGLATAVSVRRHG